MDRSVTIQTPGPHGGGKLAFANQLRAVAALCVVLSHLGGVYVLMGPLVGWITSSPETHVGRPAVLFLTVRPWLNFGAFGVAIFFLISGFVIPFSLTALRAGPFLVARAFRIYPTLWAALLLDWLAVYAQHRFYGRAMAFSPARFVENGLLIHTITQAGYVDLVNWTLAIEVKFYLLMALLRPWILRGRVLPLIGFALFAILVAAARQHGLIGGGIVLADEPMAIGFMLIGVVFHYHGTGRLSSGRGIVAGTLLTGLFVFCWAIGPDRVEFPRLTANYVYGLALFWLCYAARDRFRPMIVLDTIADLSYPLYLIHSIIGFSVITLLIVEFGLGYGPAALIGFGFVLAVAWAMHHVVELPSQNAGKRRARLLMRRIGAGDVPAE